MDAVRAQKTSPTPPAPGLVAAEPMFGPLAVGSTWQTEPKDLVEAASAGAVERAPGATYELSAKVAGQGQESTKDLRVVFTDGDRLVGTKSFGGDGRLSIGPDEFPGAKMSVVGKFSRDTRASWSFDEKNARGPRSIGPVRVKQKAYSDDASLKDNLRYGTTAPIAVKQDQVYRFEAVRQPYSASTNDQLPFRSLEVAVRDPATQQIRRIPFGEDGKVILDGATLPKGATIGLTTSRDFEPIGNAKITIAPKATTPTPPGERRRFDVEA